MRLGISFCLLFVSFGVIFAAKWECDKTSNKKFDELMSKLLTFGTSRKYPENRKELKPFCSENYVIIKDMEEYNKQCLDNISKQSVGLILFSIKSLIDSYCKKNSKYVQSILDAAPCANTATKEYNKCHIEFIDALISSKINAKSKDVVPSICCQYHKVFDCLHSTAKKVKVCTEKVLDISEDFVRGHFEKVFNLLCADYGAHTDKCDKVTKVPRLPNKDKKKRPKTFIMPLIDLLKELN